MKRRNLFKTLLALPILPSAIKAIDVKSTEAFRTEYIEPYGKVTWRIKGEPLYGKLLKVEAMFTNGTIEVESDVNWWSKGDILCPVENTKVKYVVNKYIQRGDKYYYLLRPIKGKHDMKYFKEGVKWEKHASISKVNIEWKD